MSEYGRSSAILKLNECHLCGGEIHAFYLENRQYRYECKKCKCRVEFEAWSQYEADQRFNSGMQKVKTDCAFYDSKKRCIALNRESAICKGCNFYKNKQAYKEELERLKERCNYE